MKKIKHSYVILESHCLMIPSIVDTRIYIVVDYVRHILMIFVDYARQIRWPHYSFFVKYGVELLKLRDIIFNPSVRLDFLRVLLYPYT